MREHPAAFVARYLHGDLAIPKHPDRDCAYVEAAFCARRGKDRAETLTRQAQAYRKAGLPERWGLAETRVVIRRNTPEIVALNEAWWAEIKRHSLRDQVSLPFVCWKSGVRWNVIRPTVTSIRTSGTQDAQVNIRAPLQFYVDKLNAGERFSFTRLRQRRVTASWVLPSDAQRAAAPRRTHAPH